MNHIRDAQLARGVAAADAYTLTVYILVALLGVGLVCNLAVRPVASRLFTLAPAAKTAQGRGAAVDDHPGEWGLVATGWLLAGIPIGWGVYRTLILVRQISRADARGAHREDMMFTGLTFSVDAAPPVAAGARAR